MTMSLDFRYRSDGWASFKVLIQSKGNVTWVLPGSLKWPLQRLGQQAPPLSRDPSLPALASWIVGVLPQGEDGMEGQMEEMRRRIVNEG